jgi:hypothetical protein
LHLARADVFVACALAQYPRYGAFAAAQVASDSDFHPEIVFSREQVAAPLLVKIFGQ